MKHQLEQKWRTLDNFETSVKKLETTRMQWRSKYSIKDGELEAAKVIIDLPMKCRPTEDQLLTKSM